MWEAIIAAVASIAAGLISSWSSSKSQQKAFDKQAALSSVGSSVGNVVSTYATGAMNNQLYQNMNKHLTGAQEEANAFTAQQAELNRDFQADMSNTAYQRGVADMQAAGLNPALMYGNGSAASTPTGSNASSVTPQAVGLDSVINWVATMANIKNQKAITEAEVKYKKDLGDAALRNAESNELNAESNARNAGSNERQAVVAERQAAVAEIRVGLESAMTKSNIDVNDQKMNEMATQISYVQAVTNQLPEYLAIAKKNADSTRISACAALEQAHAATQNAATQSYLADYETDERVARTGLYESQSLLNSIIKGEHEEIYKQLPERLKIEIDNLRKEGVVLDEKGRLLHRQGNLATAQTVKAYVTTATDLANCVANIASGGAGSGVQALAGSTDYGSMADIGAGVMGLY